MKEVAVSFQSVQQIAQFATLANRQRYPVHFTYKNSELDAKSLLSLCALPLGSPVTVVLPEDCDCTQFLQDIEHFRVGCVTC